MGADRAARVVRARAHAKINLTLRLLGVRPDGYHALRTTFQTLALHDTLTFRFEPGPFGLTCTGEACPADPANLVWRAAERIWAAAGKRGVPRGVRIRLAKRIPMRAGLGGGSSDAAATLHVLAAAWGAGLGPERLHDVAAGLGADVPFFLRGGTALGLERGDLLFPLADLPATWVTIVIPSYGVSTVEAYGWWDQQQDRMRSERPQPLAGASAKGGGRASARNAGGGLLAGWLPEHEFVNDLQAPVVAHHPEIGRLVRALRRAGAEYAAMSGSGSAVFGLFSGPRAAAAAARGLAGRGRQVVVTRTSRATCV